jgi:hypothetical protein
MLLITLMLIIFMSIEKLICYLLDVCDENRIINPMLGVVVTLLASSRVWLPRINIQAAHIVHILLCVACIVYIRVMIDFVFGLLFF